MSHHFYRIGLLVFGSFLVGCAYPALKMGEGDGAGGATTAAPGNGGTTATSPGNGGTSATAPGSGGTVTTVSGKGGTGVVSPGNGSTTSTAPGSGGTVTTVSGKGGTGVVSSGSGGTSATTLGSGGVTTSSGSGGITSVTTVSSSGGAAGATATPVACTASTDLMQIALSSGGANNWIGGDTSTSIDDPCGVQGPLYAYSDSGPDGIAGGTDSTVQIPAIDTASTVPGTRLSPCSSGKCCVSGATTIAPNGDWGPVWGGGIGLDLNLVSGVRQPYPGPAKGFRIVLSGALSGQAIRVAFLQSANDLNSPFTQFSGIGTYSVPFESVTCPTWTATQACIPPGPHPFAMDVQIGGGDMTAPFSLCIDSITPIL